MVLQIGLLPLLNQLPKADTRATYTIAAKDGLPELLVKYEGAVKGSDIRWNDSAGSLVISAGGKNIASCHLVRFTGNCGAKSIAHLSISAPNKKAQKQLLRIIESFAYHKTNCGILVGSDTTYPYKGNTLKTVESVGENYHVLDSVPNPNWNHKTALFWTDLTQRKHVDHWANGKVEKLT